jgi:DNA replication protein DnaC
LFEVLALARGDGHYARLLKMLSRVDLIILDDWGLAPLQRGSTIITSQVPIEHWHEVIFHDAHRLALTGDSMRKITAQRANLGATKKT